MDEQTKESIESNAIAVRYSIHAIITLIIAIGVAIFSHTVILDKGWNTNYVIFAGLLYIVIIACCFIERHSLYDSSKKLVILSVCFLMSALLLFWSDYYINLPLWVLGGIVAAALVNRNIGMMYIYFYVFHAIYLQNNMLNGLVFHFVITNLICFFIPKMKSFFSMLYMMAFTGCAIVTGSIINNHFDMDGSKMLDTFYILCTYLGSILITMIFIKWYDVLNASEEDEFETQENYEYLELFAQDTAEKEAAAALDIAENEVIQYNSEEAGTTQEITKTVSEEDALIEVEETAPDYSMFCNEKSDLLLKLKNKNRALYAQSVLVSQLASETAKEIGLDAELTKAAGLYIRIGKILDDSTEETAAKIAMAYDFPPQLVKLLDDLNHDIIVQKEAAVISMTDAILSYYSAVRHVQKSNLEVDKIVDMIICQKMFRGEFNESGLSIQEYVVLRGKLITLLNAQDKKYIER